MPLPRRALSALPFLLACGVAACDDDGGGAVPSGGEAPAGEGEGEGGGAPGDAEGEGDPGREGEGVGPEGEGEGEGEGGHGGGHEGEGEGPGGEGEGEEGEGEEGEGEEGEGEEGEGERPAGAPLCGACAVSADCDGFMVCATDELGVSFCTDDCSPPFRCSDPGFTCRDRRCMPPGGSCDNPCRGRACAAGEFCDPRSGACRAPLEALCEPCVTDDHCGRGEDRCHSLLAEGSVCGLRCDPRNDLCPVGFRCVNVPLATTGQVVTQCVPVAGRCDDPCAGRQCPDDDAICQSASGDRCIGREQALCATPCLFNEMCGTDADLCINLNSLAQPSFCGRDCRTIDDVPNPCPPGFFCAGLIGSPLRQCAPLSLRCDNHTLGAPCSADLGLDACGGPNLVCSDVFEGGVCTQTCRADHTCPEAWRRCAEVGRQRLCLPEPPAGPDLCGWRDPEHPGAIGANKGPGSSCTPGQGECAPGLDCETFAEGAAPRTICVAPCGSQADCGDAVGGGRCLAAGPEGAGRCLPAQCECLATAAAGADGPLADLFRPLSLPPCDFRLRADGVDHFEAMRHDVRNDRFQLARTRERVRNPLWAVRDLQDRDPAAAFAAGGLGGAVRWAAAELDEDVAPPDVPAPAGDGPLAAALAALFEAAGEAAPPGLADEVAGVPQDVAEAVATVLLAMAAAVEDVDRALSALEADALERNPAVLRRAWRALSTALAMRTGEPMALPVGTLDARDFLGGATGAEGEGGFGYGDMLEAAARVADALDAVDWAALAGVEAGLNVVTPVGRVVIAGPGDDIHTPESEALGGPLAFLLDTGGDDDWAVAAGGADGAAGVPVAVAIDLEGDDWYGYTEVPDENDDPLLLPSDAAGRFDGRDLHHRSDGPTSASPTGRQGSGHLGVGFLLDIGGNDEHHSLRMSQGFGALGVGVLADLGGDDTYAAEQASQGAGVFGAGLLIDTAGADTYRIWNQGQGFGGPRGVGLALDVAGDDAWTAEPGQEEGPDVLYDLEGIDEGNSNRSLAQGVGWGRRFEDPAGWQFQYDVVLPMVAGGLGELRDVAGHDVYTAGGFAQGVGWHHGIGVLHDSAGGDRYSARARAMGYGEDSGAGFLLDGGGDDAYNEDNDWVFGGMLAAAQGWGAGVVVDEAGDDVYVSDTHGLGAARRTGLALFVDNRGDDAYRATDDFSLGAAETWTEGEGLQVRWRELPSLGWFIDASGDDAYRRRDLANPDAATPRIGDDSRWSQDWNAPAAPFWERGRGIDGCGDSLVHLGDPAAPTTGPDRTCPAVPGAGPGEGEGEGEGEGGG